MFLWITAPTFILTLLFRVVVDKMTQHKHIWFNWLWNTTITIIGYTKGNSQQTCLHEYVDPLIPSDAVWRHRSGLTLAHVIACSVLRTTLFRSLGVDGGCYYVHVYCQHAYASIHLLLHKFHNALVPHPTMVHFVMEICACLHISVAKWYIVGYLSNYMHCGICKTVRLTWAPCVKFCISINDNNGRNRCCVW